MLSLLAQTGLVLGENTLTVMDVESALLGFIKLLFILAGILYVVFSLIVVRQVHIMKNTLITSFSSVILVFGYIHLVIALAVLLFFLGL